MISNACLSVCPTRQPHSVSCTGCYETSCGAFVFIISMVSLPRVHRVAPFLFWQRPIEGETIQQSLFKKCISFFGHVVSPDGTDPQAEKNHTIQDWPVPKCLRYVPAFYGLASYYRTFVKGFEAIAEPLSALTKKVTRFQSTPEAQNAFEQLMYAIPNPLTYPQPGRI